MATRVRQSAVDMLIVRGSNSCALLMERHRSRQHLLRHRMSSTLPNCEWVVPSFLYAKCRVFDLLNSEKRL